MLEDNGVLFYALSNAVKYNGKANSGAVLGKILQEKPELKSNIKELSKKIQEIVKKVNSMTIEEQCKELERLGPTQHKKSKEEKRKIPNLKNVKRKVIMRFAPNPNGPISLGHCRQALWNYFFVQKYKGSLYLRMDDTDPKIKVPLKEAYSWIKNDLKWLNIKIHKTVIQSKRLKIYHKYAEKLLKQGNAYICTCNSEEFRKLISKSIECPCRNLPPADQLERWRFMFKKYKEGQAVMRIKTNIMHVNPAVRDWPAFRIVEKSLHPLNKKDKVWPLLNFASAIDDYELKITHILRGIDLEISDIRQKYIYDYFNWRYPETLYSGKLLMSGIKSTTQIRKLIEEGKLTGWDDPRLGTIMALRRKGIQKETIIQFIKDVGINRSDINVALENLYALNRKFIDKKANRYFTIIDPVEIEIKNAPKKIVKINLHPDFQNRGKRIFKTKNDFYIAKNDFISLKENKLYRLMGCLNFIFNGTEFIYDSDDIKIYKEKGEGIMHWLPVSKDLVNIEIVMDNSEIKKGLAESEVRRLKVNEVCQMERFAYCRLDKKLKNKTVFYFTHK